MLIEEKNQYRGAADGDIEPDAQARVATLIPRLRVGLKVVAAASQFCKYRLYRTGKRFVRRFGPNRLHTLVAPSLPRRAPAKLPLLLPVFALRPPCHALAALRSLGDRRTRVVSGKETQSYWDIDKPRFALQQGPAWLKLDADTGLLTGVPDQAERWVRKALAQNPYDLAALWWLGTILEKNGRSAEAAEARTRRMSFWTMP